MSQLTQISVGNCGFHAAPFCPRNDLPPFGVDFSLIAADTFYIYSPSDTPQGLRRGSVFTGYPRSLGSAWEMPYAH